MKLVVQHEIDTDPTVIVDKDAGERVWAEFPADIPHHQRRIMAHLLVDHQHLLRPPPEKGTDEWYRQEATASFEEGGVIEIDLHAEISRGDAGGAYVQAWVWVECDMENKSDD